MYYMCTRSKIGKGRGKREPFFPPQKLLGRGGVVIQKVRAFSILLVFLLQVEVMHNLPEILVFHDILGREELEEIKLIAQPLVLSYFQCWTCDKLYQILYCLFKLR